LQIHPDKKLSAQLHKKEPDKFGDTNHKPEIAVALGKFEVFIGFKPYSDIKELFDTVAFLSASLTAIKHTLTPTVSGEGFV
jgi:mannose-6-phosphate isomerase